MDWFTLKFRQAFFAVKLFYTEESLAKYPCWLRVRLWWHFSWTGLYAERQPKPLDTYGVWRKRIAARQVKPVNKKFRVWDSAGIMVRDMIHFVLLSSFRENAILLCWLASARCTVYNRLLPSLKNRDTILAGFCLLYSLCQAIIHLPWKNVTLRVLAFVHCVVCARLFIFLERAWHYVGWLLPSV